MALTGVMCGLHKTQHGNGESSGINYEIFLRVGKVRGMRLKLEADDDDDDGRESPSSFVQLLL